MRFNAFLSALLLCVSLSMASHSSIFSGNVDTTVTVTNSFTGTPTGDNGISVSGVSNRLGAPALSGQNDSGYGVRGLGYIAVSGLSFNSPPGFGSAVGVDGEAANAQYVYGTTGYAQGGGDYGYSVYGTAPYGFTYDNWSGFFEGDVYVGGTFSNPSDIMFKKNVKTLVGGLAKIMLLKPKSYEMKTEEFKDRVYLPKGDRFGLIAQDVETVIPDLVHPVTAPARLTLEERKNHIKKDPTKFKSVDYVSLIPILVEAIQEQQAEIASLKKGQ